MEEKSGRKLYLTKKQFIIGIAVVCGIALIIEAVLLVRVFAKKQKGKSDGNTHTSADAAEEKKPESYIRKVYVAYGNGEEKLDSIEQYDYDSEGLLSHEYIWEVNSYRGNPYIVEVSEEVYYSYDEQSRLIREDREKIENYITLKERYEQKRIVSYEYKEGEQLEVFIQSAGENGNPDYTAEEKYNDAGICIARTKYVYFNGTPKKTEEITYNDRGDILSAVYVEIDSDGEISETEKKQYSYYESGIKKTSTEQTYDRNALMKTWVETKYNEYGVEIAQSKLDEGKLVPILVYDEAERRSERITVTYNSSKTEEWLFDEKGRIIKRTKEISRKISEEKTSYEATEEEFFYSDQGGESAVRTTYKRVYNGRTNTEETTYDSAGRILQICMVSQNGEETKVLYGWDYIDPAHPSKDVMHRTVYQNGKLIQETFYLVYPVAKEEQREWCWSYGEFDRCSHMDRYNKQGHYLKDLLDVFTDYISPVGQYHLEPYHDEAYDPETGSRRVETEMSFDSRGEIKSLWYLDDYRTSYIWDFDDRGNQIRTECRWEDGKLQDTLRCEYTYYTADPAEKGQ